MLRQNTRLSDRFGRSFPYIRLSVTDVCNFRCTYCLPQGYKPSGCENFLSVEEIRRMAAALAGLGVWKIRLTGGEPTVRPDFLDIVRNVAAVDGITHLALTTNGYRLPERAQDYYSAGIRAINVSIDTLDPDKFAAVTGHNRLAEILGGVDACFDAGFERVKINAVLLKGVNDGELDDFIGFVGQKNISLRFIELMQTGDNTEYFRRYHVPAQIVAEKLKARGWRQEKRLPGAGPALEFSHPSSKGTIGLISPYAKNFCASCNRLRISARGALHLCLFGEKGYSLRHLLQEDGQKEELQEKITALLQFKLGGHFLHDGDTGMTPHLASIGG